jgi:hypothetical protein
VGVVDRAVRRGMRLGWQRGLGDGSRVWLAVGATAVAVRLLQRMSAGRPTVVTEALAPGQSIIIRHLAAGE